MSKQEFRVTVIIISIVIAFNIHPMLIIPAIILGFIYIISTALTDNPSMLTNLFQPDNKDTQPLESVHPLNPIPATNPLTDTMFISAKIKAEYMQSVEWKQLKADRLAVANYKCESCGSEHNLELHHITYEQLTAEHIDDLRILCNICHNKLQAQLGYDRKTLYPIN